MTRVAAALVFLLAVPAVHSQQLPPRDAEVKPTIGTASVSGLVVTDEDQPHPVRRAIVTLSGAGLRPNRGAITDDDGRFTFDGLPNGVFTLTAARASFITSAFGAKRPGRPGTPIAVGAGQRLDGLSVKLWRGAAVSGVIKDDTGALVPGIAVTAIPARAGGPSLMSLSNNPAFTDNRGEFRIFGLEPGTYLVSARPQSSGGGASMTAPTEAQVDAVIAQVRGASLARPASTPSPPVPAPKPFDYAPVFYPGTASIANAVPVTVVAGQDVFGLDFSLQRVPTSIIEGIVTRPDGAPAARATLQLTGAAPAGQFASFPPLTINATAGADGAFRISQVTPGDYKLVAKAPVATAPPVETGFVRPGRNEPTLFAETDVSVAAADLSGLNVRLEPGMTMSGRVAFDGASKPPADLTKIQVWLRPPNLSAKAAPINSIVFVSPTFVRADGTFELTNVIPGRYLPSVTINGVDAAAWWPKSAVQGDRELLEGQIELTRDMTAPITLTFSDRRAELSGSLQSATGAPASDVFVIAFSEDQKFWRPSSRRVQAVRPDANGRYLFANLPAGTYLISAVGDVDPDEWQDPAFLAKLVGASAKVTMADGEKKTLNLRLGG